MYDHIMVPVDDSVLSSMNAELAVQLAVRLGSHITFFHAAADLGATRSGARLRSRDPQAFEESAFGDSHLVLAQYAASAELAGVPYDTQCLASGHPAQAIVDAAVAHHCDLIMMATRGEHGIAGLLHGSQTDRVLHISPVPLLVTRVASHAPVSDMEKVVAILHEEHQTMLSLATAMLAMTASRPATVAPLDLSHLAALLQHLSVYASKIHRPKEVGYLFRTLQHLAPPSQALLTQLQTHHEREQQLIHEAQALMEPVMSELGAPVGPLLDTVKSLGLNLRSHIAVEEQVLLPLARDHVPDADWSTMAAIFRTHHFPGFGAMPVEDTRKLFTRMAELQASAPA